MTQSIGEAKAFKSWRLRVRPLLVSFVLPSLISVAAIAWCRSVVGANLGLFLGSLFLASLVSPPLALIGGVSRAWIPALGVVVGIAVVWIACLSAADVNCWEWLRCCLVLAAFIFALTGISATLSAAGMPCAPAGAISTMLGLLWLSWPVWLSPWLTQGLSDWLVPANPVFAINAVLEHLGTWDRAQIAYQRLTVLNQDVAYGLPRSIAPAVILHAAIWAAGLLAAARMAKRISPKTVPSPV